jgi:serine/threonine-protein kinase
MPALRYHPVVQRLKIRASKFLEWVARKIQESKPWFRRMMLILRPSELPTVAVGPDGRYVLEAEFARGGTGILYRARDVRLDRVVALKQLFAHRKGEADTLLRFRQQAHVLARLSHPNIVQVYDLIEEAGNFWIAMELVDGENLERRLSEGALSIEETVRRGLEIADALGYAHKTGVIHRHFTPGNVLVDAKDRCKIIEFGIAQPLEPGLDSQNEKILGSPALMSPEQANGDEVDARTDVYSLGATLFLMSTGNMPFKGDARSVLSQVLTKEPPAPSRFNRAVPEALDALILRMMAKRPAERPYSMADVKMALVEIIQRQRPPVQSPS